MTSLNPSHFPSRSGKPSHAQAVYPVPKAEHHDVGGPSRHGHRRRRQKVQPVIPDLRFEQSYLLSIKPFLRPKDPSDDSEESPDESNPQVSKASGPAGGSDSKTLVTSSQQDDVFSHGRDLEVDWGMVSWVTLRDQLFSPLAQGILWGFLTLTLSSSSAGLRTLLGVPSGLTHGKVSGGPGGSTKSVGGGSAVGQTEKEAYWRSWVRSIFGGVQTAAA